MEQDATYYQKHKDDADEWGDPEGPLVRSDRRRLGAMVSVRLTPEEADLVRQMASSKGLSMSAFIRACVLETSESTKTRPELVTLNNFVEGMPTIGPPTGQPTTTTSVA